MQKYLEEIFTNRLKILDLWDPEIKLVFEKPKQDLFGDASTNVALMLSKKARSKPRDLAEKIIQDISSENTYIEKIEIAGPGFINITIKNDFFIEKLKQILVESQNFGKSGYSLGKTALVEFVSANPTGLLHLGHGRQAAIGDTISNLLEWIGYKVTREYYFNNAGRQMKILSQSVFARYKQIENPDFEFPKDGYFGDYITDIAKMIYEKYGNQYNNLDDYTFFKEYAEKFLFEEIKKTLEKLDIHFDSFFNEDSLYREGKIDEIVKQLLEKGLAFEKDGALWFSAEKIDPSLDPRVIIKSTGEPTYRLPDIAYHVEKYKRNFDLLVDIFGADHIATIPDVLAGLKALGYDTQNLKVLIHQFVTLSKDGEIVKMSKRNADLVTLDELIDEVGKDAVRYFLVMRSIGTHLEFDIALAKEQSEKNPVYYLQYAHARIASILRFAEREGFNLTDYNNINLLSDKSELDLIKSLTQFPNVVEFCAINFEPHKLTTYLYDLATAYHKFYHDCRVVTENKILSSARIALCKATQIVLQNGFKILGVSAPDNM